MKSLLLKEFAEVGANFVDDVLDHPTFLQDGVISSQPNCFAMRRFFGGGKLSRAVQVREISPQD